MENNNLPTEQTPQNAPREKTLMDVLTDCGRLKYDIEKTLNIAYAKFPDTDIDALRKKLTTAESDEHRVYYSGMDLGEYEIEEAMYSDAISGSKTSVDSHETLHALQKEKTLNDAIRDKFFPDDAD